MLTIRRTWKITFIGYVLVFIGSSIYQERERTYLIADLEKNLNSKNWKEADLITGKIFRHSINEISCKNLQVIDSAWLRSSNNRFGLTVQKYIWQSVSPPVEEFDMRNSRIKSRNEAFRDFAISVGWRIPKDERWLQYNELNFSNPNVVSPKGYLPISWGDMDRKEWDIENIFERLKNCDIK